MGDHDEDRQKIKDEIIGQWTSNKRKKKTMIIFFAMFLFCLIMFIIYIDNLSKIKEYRVQYDQECGEDPECEVTINVEEKIGKPVFFYYELEGFFQNHRKYIISKDDDQLAGVDKTVDELSSCNPVITNEEMGVTLSYDGETELDPKAAAIPCGLIASTFFNDTFVLLDEDDEEIEMSQDNIIKNSEISDQRSFENINKKRQWIDMTNPHFINWMRVSGLSNFRKLWGRIEQDLEAGQYTVIIKNNFDIKKYEAEKGVVITNMGYFGGRNVLITIFYGIFMFISFLIVIITWRKENSLDKPKKEKGEKYKMKEKKEENNLEKEVEKSKEKEKEKEKDKNKIKEE